MRTPNHKALIPFCSFSHIPYAKPAYIIRTTTRYQHSIEISQAYGTAVSICISDLLLLYPPFLRVLINALDLLFQDICLDPHPVPLPYLIYLVALLVVAAASMAFL